MPTLDVGNAFRFTITLFATTAIASFMYFAVALLLMHALRLERALATIYIDSRKRIRRPMATELATWPRRSIARLVSSCPRARQGQFGWD
jgi:hypothetical protein